MMYNLFPSVPGAHDQLVVVVALKLVTSEFLVLLITNRISKKFPNILGAQGEPSCPCHPRNFSWNLFENASEFVTWMMYKTLPLNNSQTDDDRNQRKSYILKNKILFEQKLR